MSRADRATAVAGAKPRTEYPPFGDQSLRQEWTERLAGVESLDAAVQLLTQWRSEHLAGALEESDALWIEARIEDRVAVLRLAERTPEEIDSTALTGESIAEVTERALAEARSTDDVVRLEELVTQFRRNYKPPVIPTVPFMRTETELVEILIKQRSKNWFDEPLDELRRRRNAALVPAPKEN